MSGPEIDARRLGEAIGHAMAKIGDLQADLAADFDSGFEMTADLEGGLGAFGRSGRLEMRLTLNLDLSKFQRQETEVPKPEAAPAAARPWTRCDDDVVRAAPRGEYKFSDVAALFARSEDECRARLDALQESWLRACGVGTS